MNRPPISADTEILVAIGTALPQRMTVSDFIRQNAKIVLLCEAEAICRAVVDGRTFCGGGERGPRYVITPLAAA